MVLESGFLQEREEHYALTGPLPPLAIPTTLHDSLMARLDRLATVKGLAQHGPRALIRPTSRQPKHCWKSWKEALRVIKPEPGVHDRRHSCPLSSWDSRCWRLC
jgi:hypothetical protein